MLFAFRPWVLLCSVGDMRLNFAWTFVQMLSVSVVPLEFAKQGFQVRICGQAGIIKQQVAVDDLQKMQRYDVLEMLSGMHELFADVLCAMMLCTYVMPCRKAKSERQFRGKCCML